MVIRWGILGAGDASSRFAEGLRQVPETQLAGVWTRRREAAERFAHTFGGRACYRLSDLLDSGTDAVYIGTHPDSHQELSLRALRAGKHVLCEKPAMLNQIELDEVLTEAAARHLLFMEAMKAPFFPLYRKLREHLRNDPIGDVGYVRAGSSLADIPAGHALRSVHLGGGGLMGIAPYEAFLALDWLGPLREVQTLGELDRSGVDSFATLQTRHEHGVAQLYCGLKLHGHGDALIAGTLGNIAIRSKWWNPRRAQVRYVNGRTVDLDEPYTSSGFNYETDHFCHLLRTGAKESPIMTHSLSRQMMQMLDEARAALGLVFPQEQKAAAV